MSARRLLLAALTGAALLPAGAGAAVVDETLMVPTVGGARIAVEVRRPDGPGPFPVILTYSPYNTLREQPGGTVAADRLAATYVPRGYARAVADVIGTRNSTGCWDYGGPKEQRSGVDVVNALARQPWSNGRVAMVGGSYDGTTANMVAVRGAEASGLAAIVPQAAISRWYGYAYQDGVRYFLNSQEPTDEGIDTPLAFDFGLARTPPTKPDAQSVADLPRGRYSACDSVRHTEHGYDRSPDYDRFWRERDYLARAGEVRVPVLVTHGWQDYNVKQSEGVDFYRALDNAPFKLLYMWQGPHGVPRTADYESLLSRFFDRTLKGIDNGIEREPPVTTFGRTGSQAATTPTREPAWPPPGTRRLALRLGWGSDGGVLAPGASGAPRGWRDSGATTEESAIAAGLRGGDGAWLYYESAPLARPLRLVGSAVLDARLRDSADHGQLSPTLVDVAPDGGVTPISRGHLNLRYRRGLERAVPVPPGEPVRARVRLSPQDQTIPAGHRLGLLVASANAIWALPDLPPGYEITILHGRSRLLLPVDG